MDDDREIVYVFEKLLNVQGHHVIGKAYDGNQAVKIYEDLEFPPDIVLMDYRMPQKDGLIATEDILRINPNGLIIFVSADRSIKNEAMKAGAAYFLLKPVCFPDLLMVIDHIIHSKEKLTTSLIELRSKSLSS